jgi:aminopeptidase N
VAGQRPCRSLGAKSLGTKSHLSRDEAEERARLVGNLSYEVSLDLHKEDGFRSESVIEFDATDPEAGTFLDLTATSLEEAELNGEALPEDAFDGHRLRLDRLREHNRVRVVARCAYHRTELGMHRFVDPVDGLAYLHTDFEPFDAHRVFACFDQPDLKGTFRFDVVAPERWTVVSNAQEETREPYGDGLSRWWFRRTQPLPTYVTAVVAGDYHEVRDRHRDVDLGLLCRMSLAQYLDADELFEVTKQGLEFFEAAFGYPYPFGGKYDQVFIPESNSGAMENAACITFNDLYIFRSRVTDAARERRADTVLHEMAHMWFGDLVTMRWWSDLWLNESFASFMAVFAQAQATRWTEAWTTFADVEKTWAYRQDQLPTTHPIVADIPDVESIHLNFDGITYAKGASVLRQLVAWVGQDQFLDGIKLYCKRHEFGNAELADFLAALEETSGRDLHAWAKEWLQTAGVNTLRPSFQTEDHDGRDEFSSFAVLQEAPADHPTLRRHRVAVGLYDATDVGLVRRTRVELDATEARTDVPELIGEPVPDLVLVNDDDLTFAKIRLDERSLGTVVQNLGRLDESLPRALCWTACWDMTRDGEMPARHYLQLVGGSIGRETKVGVVQSLLAQAASAVYLYGDPAHRPVSGQILADITLEGAHGAQPGSDHQLAWARAFIGAARSPEHLELVRGLLSGTVPFEGLVVDTELRWLIVRALASAGAVGEEAIAAEAERDPTDRGARHASAARAARPDPAAKEEAWRAVVEDTSLPLAMAAEIMGGFQQFGQEDLLSTYVERYFDSLAPAWESRDLPDALAFVERMYPRLIVIQDTVDRTDRYLAGGEVPAPIRRLLLEGKDGVQRALRTRAVDAASNGA